MVALVEPASNFEIVGWRSITGLITSLPCVVLQGATAIVYLGAITQPSITWSFVQLVAGESQVVPPTVCGC